MVSTKRLGDKIDFNKEGGLVPVVVFDVTTSRVLMLAYATPEAVERTVNTGYAHFYSRSRRRLWLKGETSGNKLRVVRILADCDLDSVVYFVIPEGPACHTGRHSCFFNKVWEDPSLTGLAQSNGGVGALLGKLRGGPDRVIGTGFSIHVPLLNPLVDVLLEKAGDDLAGIRLVLTTNNGVDVALATLVSLRLNAPLASLTPRETKAPDRAGGKAVVALFKLTRHMVDRFAGRLKPAYDQLVFLALFSEPIDEGGAKVYSLADIPRASG